MSKYSVIFNRSFGGVCGTHVRNEECLAVGSLTHADVKYLANQGLVSLKKISEPMKINTQCAEYDKLNEAVSKDFNNGAFSHEDAYIFYDIANKSWKRSKLLKTASHLGRVTAGFAIPNDASEKKKHNRLNNLNKVYGLGLSDYEIDRIAKLTPTDE